MGVGGEAAVEAAAVEAAAVVAVAVGEEGAVEEAGTAAQEAIPRLRSPEAGLQWLSAWPSSSRRQPTTPQEARANKSCGSSTWREVYCEVRNFATDMCLRHRYTSDRSTLAYM